MLGRVVVDDPGRRRRAADGCPGRPGRPWRVAADRDDLVARDRPAAPVVAYSRGSSRPSTIARPCAPPSSGIVVISDGRGRVDERHAVAGGDRDPGDVLDRDARQRARRRWPLSRAVRASPLPGTAQDDGRAGGRVASAWPGSRAASPPRSRPASTRRPPGPATSASVATSARPGPARREVGDRRQVQRCPDRARRPGRRRSAGRPRPRRPSCRRRSRAAASTGWSDRGQRRPAPGRGRRRRRRAPSASSVASRPSS